MNLTIIGCIFRWSLTDRFEQFGSLHSIMCAPRKYIGCSGIRTRYPQLWVNHATKELSCRHTLASRQRHDMHNTCNNYNCEYLLVSPINDLLISMFRSGEQHLHARAKRLKQLQYEFIMMLYRKKFCFCISHYKSQSLNKKIKINHINPFNPLTAELFNWNFHPLEVDAIHNLQVSENYADLTK